MEMEYFDMKLEDGVKMSLLNTEKSREKQSLFEK